MKHNKIRHKNKFLKNKKNTLLLNNEEFSKLDLIKMY